MLNDARADSRHQSAVRKRMNLVEVSLYGGLLALANFAGGALLAVPRRLRGSTALMRHFVALGAGFMLAVLFFEVLPEVLGGWVDGAGSGEGTRPALTIAMSLVLGGYLTVHLCEHVFAYHLQQDPHEACAHENLPETTVYAALAGLSVHTFFDGVTIATGFLVDFQFGLLIFIAMLLHKVPEGMTAASIMLAGGHSSRAALFATASVACATLLGVLVVALVPLNTETIIRYALPFAAGVTLYIAASDLIPEINHRHGRNPLAPLVVFGGIVLFYVLHRATGH